MHKSAFPTCLGTCTGDVGEECSLRLDGLHTDVVVHSSSCLFALFFSCSGYHRLSATSHTLMFGNGHGRGIPQRRRFALKRGAQRHHRGANEAGKVKRQRRRTKKRKSKVRQAPTANSDGALAFAPEGADTAASLHQTSPLLQEVCAVEPCDCAKSRSVKRKKKNELHRRPLHVAYTSRGARR